MPLPSYVPRSDSFGNWYFGGFQVDSVVEAGYGAPTSLTATIAEWESFLDASIGSSNWTKSGSGTSINYFFRFANPWEPLTGTISTTANYRFAWQNSILNDPIYLNTATTGTPVTINRSGVNIANIISASKCAFAVANSYGMWVAELNKGSAGALGTGGENMYAGWVKDPVFPTNTTERIRNCVIGLGGNNGTSAFYCSRSNASTLAGIVATNNVITCQSSTPGANVTDLCAIDTNTSNLNIGSLHNSLIYPGTLTVGQIYRIPPASDPDGNTEQNIWLCVTNSAFAFNGSTSSNVTNCSRLIRVWSNNIT